MNRNNAFIDVVMILLALVILALSLSALAGGVPNPAVTQDNIHQTVCVPGWTDTIRPPSSYTQAWEKANGGNIDTVVDHKIPLCAGGNPTDPGNYQLQLKPESYRKDSTEKLVCKLLCAGKLTLDEAQRMFWQ